MIKGKSGSGCSDVVSGFRYDINGMRAFAVMLVLLFHFSIDGFASGFIGVDIFFVISGYLMTSIIFSDSSVGFSLKSFYSRRVKRIFPAFFFMLFFVIVYLAIVLDQFEYKRAVGEAIYSGFFASNYNYWINTGYFSDSSKLNWFLHTWTLSLEAQFYIVYPIILVILRRLLFNNLYILLVLCFFMFSSLLISLLWAGEGETAAFFLLPFRAWEFLLGAVVWFLPKKINKKASSFLFFVSIIIFFNCFFFISESDSWPSMLASLPALGAAFLLAANSNSLFLKNSLVQWVGFRSYSIYLWHWPISVLYATSNSLWNELFFSIFMCFLVGHISYMYVETKLVRSYWLSRFFNDYKALVFLVLFFIYAGVSIAFNIKDPRVIAAQRELHNINPRREECHTNAYGSKGSPGCIFGSGNVGVILIGDSHAMSFVTGLQEHLSSYNKSLLLWSFSACPTITGIYRSYNRKGYDYDRCVYSTQWIKDELVKHKGVPVIIVNSSNYYYPIRKVYFDEVNKGKEINDVFVHNLHSSITSTFCDISEGRELYVLRPVPIMKFSVPQKVISNINNSVEPIDVFVNRQDYLKDTVTIRKAQDLSAEKCGFDILDPSDYLCDNGLCLGSIDGKPVYYDKSHLSESGSLLVKKVFEKIVF